MQRISSKSVNGRPANPDPLISCYDELNGLWKQAEEQLAAMRVSVPVEVEVKTGYGAYSPNADEPDYRKTEYLGWHKHQKDWRICLGVHQEEMGDGSESWEWKPVAECPMEHRVELAPHFHELKAKMKEARQRLVPQVAAAVASLKEALD